MRNLSLEAQSCINSAAQWRRQATYVREHANRPNLSQRQRETLLREAETCDRQADWWLQGAEEYEPVGVLASLESILP
jgi:hypothetical protein